jgi:hypothetical protein
MDPGSSSLQANSFVVTHFDVSTSHIWKTFLDITAQWQFFSNNMARLSALDVAQRANSST